MQVVCSDWSSPTALVLLQPDAGSALVYSIALFFVLFREGLDMRSILSGPRPRDRFYIDPAF